MKTDISKLGLYPHNIDSYQKVAFMYEKGEKVVGIVHATGTGKSYNALQLALDNKDKNILYITPTLGIIEHIKKIIENNPNVDFENDFPNLNFRTYLSLTVLSEEEIKNLPCDLLIVDEFHHIGAPIWGERINKLIETHPNIQVFGMTAYTKRNRGKSYERDMADPEGTELFSGKIASRYDLCDAMIDGIIPKPIYRSAYIELISMEEKIEKSVRKLNHKSREYKEYMRVLNIVKKHLYEAPTIPKILQKYIKPDGKYIFFCPPSYTMGVNDIETIKAQAKEWFKSFVPEEDIVFYTSTNEMGKVGDRNRDAFYRDVTLDGQNAEGKLRVMFAINQYNEGIHAPNIDGVIMGRDTKSDIVFYEQLGRALSVRGNTKEKVDSLMQYSTQELESICVSMGIAIKKNSSKIDLIEKIIAPVVIDLSNNYTFIKELESDLRKKYEGLPITSSKNFELSLEDTIFDIEIEGQDLYEMLLNIKIALSCSWEKMFGYAQKYYELYGDLEIPYNFRTNDGITYDADGEIHLGAWIAIQRSKTNPLSERGKMLTSIGMRFEIIRITRTWEEVYEYAKKYYEHHKNINIPSNFKTDDGYTYKEDGKISLGRWLVEQKSKMDPESEKGKLLSNFGIVFSKKRKFYPWETMYQFAKIYYEHYGNLEIPETFRTDDGFTYKDDGKYYLGTWIRRNRRSTSKESEKGRLLLQIGMRFEMIKSTIPWDEMFKYADAFYSHYNHLQVPQKFRTDDGYTYKEDGKINLGKWIQHQREYRLEYPERELKLNSLEMVWNIQENKNEVLNICQKYNIDININKDIIKFANALMFQLKIDYLLEREIPLVNDQGYLNEIFLMLGRDFLEKLRIETEDKKSGR